MKTEGPLQERMKKIAPPFAGLLLVAIVAVSIWTPLADPHVAERWFSFPNILFLAPVPLLVLLSIYLLLRTIKGNPYQGPFVAALALAFLGYTGMAISIWPHIVPPHITIWEAASPVASQGFALVGTLFILPFILGYTAWSYYVFRGKVRAGAHYH
jgi:cytochrome d ubiquinol oxidase subunit II